MHLTSEVFSIIYSSLLPFTLGDAFSQHVKNPWVCVGKNGTRCVVPQQVPRFVDSSTNVEKTLTYKVKTSTRRGQSPAPVCDRAAAGSDPGHMENEVYATLWVGGLTFRFVFATADGFFVFLQKWFRIVFRYLIGFGWFQMMFFGFFRTDLSICSLSRNVVCAKIPCHIHHIQVADHGNELNAATIHKGRGRCCPFSGTIYVEVSWRAFGHAVIKTPSCETSVPHTRDATKRSDNTRLRISFLSYLFQKSAILPLFTQAVRDADMFQRRPMSRFRNLESACNPALFCVLPLYRPMTPLTSLE